MDQAAIGCDLARVHPVVDHADAKEERRRQTPWLSIWNIAPWTPCMFMTKMPIVTKPMWVIDE